MPNYKYQKGFRKIIAIVIISLGLFWISAVPVLAADQTYVILNQTAAEKQINNDLASQLVAKISPSVVTVNVSVLDKTKQGTGFFISPHGYLVTNWHVAEGSGNIKYSITLSDGQEVPATLIAKDTTHDVAVLKAAGDNYQALPLGDSSALKTGQTVIAVGDAPGPNGTASVGSVVSFGNNIHGSTGDFEETLHNLTETDSNITAGYSGGPLINLQGEAVGIDVASSKFEDNESFAIPINDAKQVLSPFAG